MRETIGQHRFGVNYTPSRHWYFFWNDWDGDAVTRDLDAIAALGADHIRLMVMWPYFQPNPSYISRAHLDRLVLLTELAEGRGLDVCVTLLNGFLSGYRFIQDFVENDNFYTSASNDAVIEQYMRAVADTLSERPNILGFDLGNELNCAWTTKDTAAADRWMDRWLTLAESLRPDGVHVNGVDHGPWMRSETFSAEALACRQRIISLHTWIEFTGARRRGGPFDPCCTQLLPAMAALARSFAGDAERPVWVQEYGASESWMEPAEIPRFLVESTRAGIDGGVAWFTWWASHDLSRDMRFAELEYSLGLLSVDNKTKPQAKAFRELAAAYRGKPVEIPTANPVLSPPSADRDVDSTWRWLNNWIEQAGGEFSKSDLASADGGSSLSPNSVASL